MSTGKQDYVTRPGDAFSAKVSQIIIHYYPHALRTEY
jgi:hypothetical protein